MNSIYISDQGELLLIDAPEKPERGMLDSHVGNSVKGRYEAALASAIEKGVKFKDELSTKKILQDLANEDRNLEVQGRFYFHNHKGQTFPLPTGYKVSFEDDCTLNECNCPNPAKEGHVKLAILSKLEEEKVVAPSEEVKHFLLGKKIRYRYVDWEEGSFTPWSPCTERELKTILEDHSIEIVQFKP